MMIAGHGEENEEGEAMYEKEQILDQISLYFSTIFTSSGPGCADTVNQAIEPCITEVNDRLISIPSAIDQRCSVLHTPG